MTKNVEVPLQPQKLLIDSQSNPSCREENGMTILSRDGSYAGILESVCTGCPSELN